MSFIKGLIADLKKAKTPKKFYSAAQALIDAATLFLDDNTYSSHYDNGIEVNVKVYSHLESFEDALERLAEKHDLSEDVQEYITEELGDDWANKMYESWLDFERENIMLYLEDFTDVINEKEVRFAGRSGGHLILGDDNVYREAIEEIEYILDNNFNKEGEYVGDEKFSEFLDTDGSDVLHWAEVIEDLDTFDAAIDKIKEALKGIPELWKEELYFGLNEWYDNYFSYDDVQSYVDKRDAHLKKGEADKKDIDDPQDKNMMSQGGDVIQKDTSLFGVFMDIRFPHVTTDDSYYRTWINRWNKGIDLLWNESDDTTRSALIEAIEQKAKNIYYFKEVPIEFKDASLPVSYLFVKNRFSRDFNDSYAQTWISRLSSPIEKAIGQMDTQSMGVLVSVLKFKKQNP